jgi:hypothetical protein
VGNIFQVTSFAGSLGTNTYNEGYIAASNGGTNLANQNSGTIGSTFSVKGLITPGLTNQMSGTYTSTVTILASLD